MKVLTLGDSITADGRWQTEFARIALKDAGVTLQIVNAAVGGTGMGYWPSRVGALLTQHEPDLVTLFAGTNDLNQTAVQSEAVGTAFRQTVETIHTHRTPPILTLPGLIQYSDPTLAAQWVVDSEPLTNDEIYRNIQYYVHVPGWFAGVADFQTIPSGSDWIDDGGYHPTARGYKAMGRLTYDRAAPGLGWPPCSEPPIAGLSGHRKGYPRPMYIAT